MKAEYHVTGTRRKAMVQAVCEAFGGRDAKYLGAPTFSYRVEPFEIERDATALRRPSRAEIERLRRKYPAGATAEFISMEDAQSPSQRSTLANHLRPLGLPLGAFSHGSHLRRQVGDGSPKKFQISPCIQEITSDNRSL